ncbi:MAG TPA: MBL fold metallo-hydrolase [Bradyrhizobium sp.]|jgi:ribonuclease Z|nr:MBL fold metallo-hydrolase [Bradyrhizobium sp.]
MRIRLLGTGTPTPSLRRMCSGYVVETGDDVIVFDHGFGAHHRLLELGIPATKVSHLFLTHLHYDHCGDYARLVLTRWDQGAGKVPELSVFGPTPLTQFSAALLGESGAFNSDLVARTSDDCSLRIYEARGGVLPRLRPRPHLTELAPGAVVKERGWTLEVSEARHFHPALNCLAYRLTTAAGTFVYSGDSGPCEAIRKLARNCDVLVHMCHYISGTQLSDGFAESCMGHMELATLARDVGVRNLVTTHITEQFDKPGVRERVIGEMSAVFKGNLFFGEDLMEIPLSPPALEKLM